MRETSYPSRSRLSASPRSGAHRGDADLDERPADRPAQYQKREQDRWRYPRHAAFRLGSTPRLNWLFSASLTSA